MKRRKLQRSENRMAQHNGLLALLLLSVMAFVPIADARANYWFKVQLQNSSTGELLKFKASADAAAETSEWSGWIYAEAQESGTNSAGEKTYVWRNSLRDLVENQKTVTDEYGNTVSLYDDNAKHYVDEGRDILVVGIAFKGVDEPGYVNEEHFQILDGDDYFYQGGASAAASDTTWVFTRIKNEIQTLDLSQWGKKFYGGSRYFADMGHLKTLMLPDNDFEIRDEYMFADCVELENIVWGNNSKIKEVGKGAFRNCYLLPQKDIQKMVDGCAESGSGCIGAEAFYCCLQLKTVTFPKQIHWIGDEAFSQPVPGDIPYVTQLSAVNFDANEHLELGNKVFAECAVLKDVNVNGAQIQKLGEAVFADARKITNESVKEILESYAQYGQDEHGNISIPAALFWGCNGIGGDNQANFTKLTIPANVVAIGTAAFAAYESGESQPWIKDIYVSRGIVPECMAGGSSSDLYNDYLAFANLIPNKVTIHFSDDAASYSTDSSTGYTTYMTDGSEFQRLLTKDLYAEASTYDVVPQQHAIVRLHRALKAGWNTLCLPFGATAAAKEIPQNVSGSTADGAEYANSRLVQRALTPANIDKTDANLGSTNFMIAVYRDYVEDTQTFRFLHLQDYDTDPIASYEPFMVRMDEADVAAADGVYTFENVDLNYQWKPAAGQTNAGYSLSSVEILQPEEMQAGSFSGQAEAFVPFNDGKGNRDKYVFTGTFKSMTGTVGSDTDDISGFVTADDYYIQNASGTTKYYQYQAGSYVGVRGFSGWFHAKSQTGGYAKLASIDVRVVSGNDEGTTAIASIGVEDGVSLQGNIYTLSGQFVGVGNSKTVSRLPSGMYIVNGKKVVVK